MIKRFKDFFKKKEEFKEETYDSLFKDGYLFGIYIYFCTPDQRDIMYPTMDNIYIKDENDLMSSLKKGELVFNYINIIFAGLNRVNDDDNIIKSDSFKLQIDLSSKLANYMSKHMGKDICNELECLFSILEEYNIYSSNIVMGDTSFGHFIRVNLMSAECLKSIFNKII